MRYRQSQKERNTNCKLSIYTLPWYPDRPSACKSYRVSVVMLHRPAHEFQHLRLVPLCFSLPNSWWNVSNALWLYPPQALDIAAVEK